MLWRRIGTVVKKYGPKLERWGEMERWRVVVLVMGAVLIFTVIFYADVLAPQNSRNSARRMAAPPLPTLPCKQLHGTSFCPKSNCDGLTELCGPLTVATELRTKQGQLRVSHNNCESSKISLGAITIRVRSLYYNISSNH